MHWLRVINWIGVFALAVGSLITVIHGHFISALFGILLTSILVSSLIPLQGKLALPLNRLKQFEVLQRVGITIGMFGSWILAGIGRWQFVPAAVVLTLTVVIVLIRKLVEIKRRRRGTIFVNQTPAIEKTMTISTPTPTPTMITQGPPEYTSTVQIIQDSKPPAEISSAPSIIQTPNSASISIQV